MMKYEQCKKGTKVAFVLDDVRKVGTLEEDGAYQPGDAPVEVAQVYVEGDLVYPVELTELELA